MRANPFRSGFGPWLAWAERIRFACKQAPTTTAVAAVAAVAATYFYFLIFSEFALLELVTGAAPERLRVVMGALGVSGIAGACIATFVPEWRRRFVLATAFLGCAAGAALAATASTAGGLAIAAVLSGFALGNGTTLLAWHLGRVVPRQRLGLVIGIGTGVAYACSNLPVVFRAAPESQALVAGLVMLGAAALPALFSNRSRDVLGLPDLRDATSRLHPVHDETLRLQSSHPHQGIGAILIILLALVWLDSAAFYIVQHDVSMRARTWGGTGALLANAVVHLVGALLSGWMLDRARLRLVLGGAFLLLGAAALMLNGTLPAIAPGWAYVAGVSLYSVALVDVPARTGSLRIAALVFAVAGWAGSALGIGMAQDLARIPNAFVLTAALVVAIGLVSGRKVIRWLGVILASVGLVKADEVSFGRDVYIAEGCLHCHSQFIRPRVASEVLNWGPAKSLGEALSEKPPLFGTRRQGPDLSRVGNRRSPEWNRLHLLSPQSVSPGSKMPSYAHLFRDGDERGPALIAYLASLGADTTAARQAQIAAWTPGAVQATSPAESAALFNRLCAQCHGASGRGDGPLAPRLSLRPPDWLRDPWRRVPTGADLDVVLSRIIKFGLPGLPMAGHEYLPDPEILGLARHVQLLHKSVGSVPPAAGQP